MRALLYGVKPEPQPEPQEDNALLRNLAHTPMRLASGLSSLCPKVSVSAASSNAGLEIDNSVTGSDITKYKIIAIPLILTANTVGDAIG